MNKNALIKKIVEHLTEKVSLHIGAAKAARAEATDEECKAEDTYDTRGLEASYLAAGQSRQVAELAHAVRDFATMKAPSFGRDDAIDLGALVELEQRGETSWYFIGPCAGGLEVEQNRQTVLVITPQSPLGQQLVGRKQGDVLKMKIGGLPQEYRVVSVA